MPNKPSHLDDELNLAAGIRYRLGEMLLQAGRITHDKLETAIEEQRRSGGKLGRILLRLGLDIGELDVALEFQQRQAGNTPAFGLLRLGELMVSHGLITREQMAESLTRQKQTGKKLGEDLVASGLVQPHQIAHTLQIQQKMVTAALVTALALGSMSSASNSAPKHFDAPAISSTVRQKQASFSTLSQPDELVITADDISRGHVDVPGTVKAKVKNNSPGGYMLIFENLSDFLHQTHVRGLGDEVKLDGKGGVITQPGIMPGKGEAHVEMGFSFSLANGALPGIYDWPVRISAMPL